MRGLFGFLLALLLTVVLWIGCSDKDPVSSTQDGELLLPAANLNNS